MSSNRLMFSLGDGIDSITGLHKGRGIITSKETKLSDMILPLTPPKKELPAIEDKDIKRSPDNKLTPIMSGDTQYDISIVSDYTDLYQALDLKTCLTATISPSNLSSESALFKKAKLSKQAVSLLIKGKHIGFVYMMPPDAKISPEYIDNLVKRRSTFLEAHGDEYISQIMVGKKIYALINFANTSKEEALQIKQTLEAKLASKVSLSAKGLLESNTAVKHTLTDISLEFSGVELGLPSMASTIEGLFTFIDQFNKAEIIGSPIGFVSEPYVTLLPVREASDLAKQMAMVQGLLAEYDRNYNKIRILIPSIEKLVYGVRYFQIEDDPSKDNIDRLQNFLDTANKFKKIMEDLILEISLNKSDLTCLPEKLNDKIILDIPPPLTKQDELDDDSKSSEVHKRQYVVRNQLNAILKLCAEAINNMESEMDIISRKLVAEVVRITPADDHVHINLPPSGATIRWDILNNEEKNDGGIHSFNIKIKDTSKFISSYSILHKRIASGMETKLNITPHHRLKILPDNKCDYVIVGSIVGLQALDPAIPRHSTSWIGKKWQKSKAKEPSKGGTAIEFNGKTRSSKMSAPWINHKSTDEQPSPSSPNLTSIHFFNPPKRSDSIKSSLKDIEHKVSKPQ